MDLCEDSKMSTPLRDEEERVEPGELLEENWFFGNLLDRKTRMSRCFSDPCPSSKHRQEVLTEKSYEETYSSIKKLQIGDDHQSHGELSAHRRPSLMRAPSMPPCMPRQVSPPHQAKRRDPRGSESRQPSPLNNLRRAPSLPLSVLDRDEDEESEYSMGRLIRQASLGHSDTLPPRRSSTSKITIPSTIPRHRPQRKLELENRKMDGSEERIRQYALNQAKAKKSLADLESEEVEGFKELGFNFVKKELNPSVVKILPGLQEEKGDHINNVGNKKSAEDMMKAQLKFWARAVASNVRQEC